MHTIDASDLKTSTQREYTGDSEGEGDSEGGAKGEPNGDSFARKGGGSGGQTKERALPKVSTRRTGGNRLPGGEHNARVSIRMLEDRHRLKIPRDHPFNVLRKATYTPLSQGCQAFASKRSRSRGHSPAPVPSHRRIGSRRCAQAPQSLNSPRHLWRARLRGEGSGSQGAPPRARLRDTARSSVTREEGGWAGGGGGHRCHCEFAAHCRAPCRRWAGA